MIMKKFHNLFLFRAFSTLIMSIVSVINLKGERHEEKDFFNCCINSSTNTTK